MNDLSIPRPDPVSTARQLASNMLAKNAAAIDRSEAYPWDNVSAFRRAGLMGMSVPRAYGGRGANLSEIIPIITEISKVCAISGRIIVDSNLGGVSTVFAYGSEAQKSLMARHLLAGDKPAICISEPGAGSAAADMETSAEKQGETYVINGEKHWITGGGISKLYLVFARVFDEDGVESGIGGFLIEAEGTKGFRVGDREPTMGLRGIPECHIHFEDMRVPASSLILPPGGLEKGFARLMDAYNSQRVGAAAVALGIAEGAFELAVDYTKQRQQFGRPIAEFQGLQWILADMSTALKASRLLIEDAARSAKPFPEPIAAAQAKVFAAETAIKVTNDALQLFGAAGYSRNNPIERMVRDARMFTIGGGTTQMLRNLIAGKVLNRKLPQSRDGYSTT